MQVTMLWYGGANYAAPRIEDAETFTSMRELLDELDSRKYDSYYPGVYEPGVYDLDETGRMTVAHVFAGAGPLEGDEYPDRVVTLGPRGGFRVERT